MKIELYIARGCASREPLIHNLNKALAEESVTADVEIKPLDALTAVQLKLGGSPSVLINGADIEPTGSVGFS